MVAPHLAEAGLNVIAVELPGHGRDYAPIGRQDLETMQNTWKLS
jgi:alpha-beta hydrolase superfamily lysophospholipase